MVVSYARHIHYHTPSLKSQFATSSSAASYILKLEILNRNTTFYVRLLFAFTVYHTFFYGDSHNLAISAESPESPCTDFKSRRPTSAYK